jgi:hypothetical protein
MPGCPLSLNEREKIYYGIVCGETVTAIAAMIGRHRCSVSAEIARNDGREGYRPFRAHRRAAEFRKRPKSRLFERVPELAAHVASRLGAKDSPMTIAVELGQGVYPEIAVTVSHETIYHEIYAPERKVLPRNAPSGACTGVDGCGVDTGIDTHRSRIGETRFVPFVNGRLPPTVEARSAISKETSLSVWAIRAR